MTWGASWRRAVAAVVVGGALAGCSGGDPLSEYTSSASPTEQFEPKPLPKEPELPEQERSEDGAVSMAHYVMNLYSYMYATNDTAAFEAISGKDCRFCEVELGLVARNAEQSWRVDGTEISVKSAIPRDVDGFFFLVEVGFEQGEQYTYDENLTVVRTGEPSKGDVVFGLNWVDDAWEINGISIAGPGATGGATP